jgi:hypothetical protein
LIGGVFESQHWIDELPLSRCICSCYCTRRDTEKKRDEDRYICRLLIALLIPCIISTTPIGEAIVCLLQYGRRREEEEEA